MMFDGRESFAGSRVLVAEDDPFIAEELSQLLAAEGAEVVGPFPTVRAAMAVIGSEMPDAAVLDVNLRDRSSAPVASALHWAAVPVVLVTGYPRGLLDDPAHRGAPVLSKPLRRDELLSVLCRVMCGEHPPSEPAPGPQDETASPQSVLQ